jgi:hypothetical protein
VHDRKNNHEGLMIMTTMMVMGSGKDMPAPRWDAGGHYHVDTIFSSADLDHAHAHVAEGPTPVPPMPADPCTGWDQG